MTSIVAKKRTRSGKKPQIIALAAEAFSERGYSAASLRDIGQRAGVTAASLYHHFENKEDLLRAIVMDGADRLTETLKVEVTRENDPRARLEQVIRAHIAFTCENIEVTKIILEEMRFLNEVDFANMREKNYAILDIYRACCVAAGQPDLSPRILSKASGEIKDQYLDASKARNLLGWAATTSLSTGLAATFDWYERFLVSSR